MVPFVFFKQDMSCLGSSATWEHPQWVATMFVISKKKEGEWNWETQTRISKCFLLKCATVQSRVCIHGRQNTHVVTRYTFPTKEMKIVTDCRCDESILIPLRSTLKCIICSPVLAVPNLCFGAAVLYPALFIWASPNFLSIPNNRKPIKLWADTSIATTAVLILAVILMCCCYLALGILDFPSFEL